MPNFNRGDTLTLTLDYDDVITFTGKGNVTNTPSGGSSTNSYLNGTNLTYGPFKNTSTSIVIVCDTAGSYTISSDLSVDTTAKYYTDANGNATGLIDPKNGIIIGIGASNKPFLSKNNGFAASAAISVARKGASNFIDMLSATPLAGWGFVKGRAAYSGNCVKVRRVSDNATLDIPYRSDNIVDVDRMIAFAGASTLTLDTSYDYMTGGFNMTQTTASNQPTIDLKYLKNGIPTVQITQYNFMNIPAGVTISDTKNASFWSALGFFSYRQGCQFINFGSANQFGLSLSPYSKMCVQPVVNGSYLDFTGSGGGMQTVPNSNGVVVGVNSSSSEVRFFRNDTSFAVGAATSVSTAGGSLGSSSNLSTVDWQGSVVFNSALSTEDAQRLQYAMSVAYGAVISPLENVLLVGDSMQTGAVGYNYNYAKTLSYYLGDKINLMVCALGGETLQTEASQVNQYTSPTFRTGMTNVAINTAGVNDISFGRTATQLIADVTTWHTAMKTAGFKTAQAVLYARNIGVNGYTSTMEEYRATFNAWVRANNGSGLTLDDLVDFEIEPTFLPNISTADFPDNLHPSLIGYRKASPILADTIIRSLYGAT
jgi:hypothetical protein